MNEDEDLFNKSSKAYCHHFISPYHVGNDNKKMTLNSALN